jgi:3-hydroxybutyryl-CoA dehydrogenase
MEDRNAFAGRRQRASIGPGAIDSCAVDVQRIGVVGLGAMGAGIAQVAVEAGFEVLGREVTPELGEAAAGRIGHFLTRKVEKGQRTQTERDDAVARLTTTTELEALADCDLVIEAIVEELDVKQALFAELSAIAPEAILATNTSALSVTDIAAAAARPERVVGLHFFNPAPVLPLVEVVRTERTDADVYEAAYAFAAALGKEPVRCNDTPGFVVNRVLIPLLNDCVRVLDEARVTPEDLDRALRFGLNWPIGPCALIDLIGIDVHVHASEALHGALGEDRMAPPERLVAMQRDGNLGRKTGRGFFTYD